MEQLKEDGNPVKAQDANPEIVERLQKAQDGLANLAETYQVEFVPILQYTDRGIVAALQIRDIKPVDEIKP